MKAPEFDFKYNKLTIFDSEENKKVYSFDDVVLNELEYKFIDDNLIDSSLRKYALLKEIVSLKVLKEWHFMTNHDLVPEYIETRSLTSPESEIEQGKIEIWIDMFKTNNNLAFRPTLIDISPRKPLKFQLRIIIYRTEEVELDDVNLATGERTSDIYIKCYLENAQESQKTDIHYRSLNGDGNFNWRFIFDFEYLPEEAKIVYTNKSIFKSLESRKEDPIRNLIFEFNFIYRIINLLLFKSTF